MCNIEKETKRIRIGVIDSGIEDFEGKYNGGSICKINGNLVFKENDTIDTIGHGTAISYIIRKKNPDVELFIVKIFHETLTTDVDSMILAIKKCIENDCEIINISAGTYEYNEDLEKMCILAENKNIVIVAAYANKTSETLFYPAAFPNCIGVKGGCCHGKNDYYVSDHKKLNCIARGDKQRVKWINEQWLFIGGDSFATAHMTGIISLMYGNTKKDGLQNIKERIFSNTLKECPVLINDNIGLYEPQIHTEKLKKFFAEMFTCKFDDDCIALSDDLELSEKFLGNINNRIVEKFDDIEKLLVYDIDKYNTIIILKEKISEYDLRSLLAINKVIYFFYPKQIYKTFETNNMINPIYCYDDYIKQKSLISLSDYQIQAPIMGIFTNNNDLEFQSFVLQIKNSLKKRGYNVVCIDTKYNKIMFDDEFSLCLFEEDQSELDCIGYLPIIRYIIKAIDYLYQPDIILFDSQATFSMEDKTSTIKTCAILSASTVESFIYFSNLKDDIHKKEYVDNIEIFTKAPNIYYANPNMNFDIDSIINSIINFYQ